MVLEFPSAMPPPGLERPEVDIEDRVRELLGKHADNAHTLEGQDAIREALLKEVDAWVSEQTGAFLRHGQKMMRKMQEDHNEKMGQFTSEIAQNIEKQQEIETDQQKLKLMLSALQETTMHMTGSRLVKEADMPQSPAPATQSSEYQEAVEGYGGDLRMPTFRSPMYGSPCPAPLSLADVLSSPSPQRTPVSLAYSLQATPELAQNFTFTIRKADGADLGLNVSHHDDDTCLRVEGIRAEGAVDAWNRQCLAGGWKEKVVIPGDRILQVNQVSGEPSKMLEECRDKQLLKLTIKRGDWSSPASTDVPSEKAFPAGILNSPLDLGTIPESPPDSYPSTPKLRADASDFVPASASALAA